MSPKWNGTMDANGSEVATHFSDLRELEELFRAPCETCARKDRFIALASHELRNMVTPVVMALDICTLSRETETNSEFLQHALERARKLSQLIDVLFDASRIAEVK